MKRFIRNILKTGLAGVTVMCLILHGFTGALALSPYGDLNHDGVLSAEDLALLKQELLKGGDDLQYDMNGDATVNIVDLVNLKKKIVRFTDDSKFISNNVTAVDNVKSVYLSELFSAKPGSMIQSGFVKLEIDPGSSGVTYKLVESPENWEESYIDFNGQGEVTVSVCELCAPLSVTFQVMDRASDYAADFSVSRAFSDNMVVQRNEKIRVWGWAEESENGKKVAASFKGMSVDAVIQNGEWCVTFDRVLEADTSGDQMRIYTAEKETLLSDVLVGDVYMVIGQSNVAYPVLTHVNNTDDQTHGGGLAAIDPNSIIRLNRTNTATAEEVEYPERGSAEVCQDVLNRNQWTKTTQAQTTAFSALGYYFAKSIVEKTDYTIPVGLIEIGFSGQPLGSFLPNEIADEFHTDTYNMTTGVYTTTGSGATEGSGRYIYNRHMYPFEKYALAGVVWYQGESDYLFREAQRYNRVFSALMNYMRGTHNLVHKNFPVFVMEFPSIYAAPEGYTDTWHYMDLGMIRSYIGSVPMYLENSYVSVSSDLWSNRNYYNNLHPFCKYEQAERMANLADAVIYQNQRLDEVTGPILESYQLSDDGLSAVLTFTNVADGLTTCDGGENVHGILGVLGKYPDWRSVAPLSAKITSNNQITVTFAQKVKAVVYHAEPENFYGQEINLCNSNGCPASAFSTGFEDFDYSPYISNDYVSDTASGVGLVKKAFDMFKIDTENYFTVGKVANELAAANNRVETENTSSGINITGWAGYQNEILVFGYAIDGTTVLDTYVINASASIRNAGGEYAKKFSFYVPIGNLSIGEHTVDLLVLTDNGTVAKMLSFVLTINETKEEEGGTTDDDQEILELNDSRAGYKAKSIDTFRVDGVNMFTTGKVASELAAANNTVEVSASANQIYLYGWIGFTHEIVDFGYCFDNGEATYGIEPIIPPSGSTLYTVGGEYARRFSVNMDISGLYAGEHTIDVLVRLSGEDAVVVKMLSFKLVISGYESLTDVGYKGSSFDTFKVDGVNMFTTGKVSAELAAANNTVEVSASANQIYLYGWIGFTHEIVDFGYCFDNGETVCGIEPIIPPNGSALYTAGGEYARRFGMYLNIGDLGAGEHTVDLLARVNLGSSVPTKMLSFTLIITDE